MSRRPITIYTTAWCPYCQRAKALLSSKGLAFEEIDVDATPGAREAMIARSTRRTVPQIFFGDLHVGGCDDLLALEQRGEIEKIMAVEDN